jgi:hypothetical protein
MSVVAMLLTIAVLAVLAILGVVRDRVQNMGFHHTIPGDTEDEPDDEVYKMYEESQRGNIG